MEKINNLSQLEEYLKAHRVLCMNDKKGITYIVMRDDRIRIQNEYAGYVLSYDDFLALYKNHTFYVYEKSEEDDISVEKDNEYYSWQHK